MAFTYEYPRPAVTVDAVVLRLRLGRIEILLITRGHPPFQGMCAIPGGFLEMDEEPATGAARELTEETGLADLHLAPLFGAGQVGRDPRSRNITLVYGTLVNGDNLNPKGSDDAVQAEWYPLEAPPPMAFDHATILQEVAESLRWQARTALVGRRLFPGEFSAADLNGLHRLLTGDPDDQPLERGLRLGLLQTGSRTDLFRFRPGHGAHPDWTPLPW